MLRDARWALLLSASTILVSSTTQAQTLMAPAPQAALAPAPQAASGLHQVALVAEMTGDPAFDAHLRAATDGLVLRLRARGFDLTPPAALGAAMQSRPPSPAALRAAVGAELVVRIAVRYRDSSRAVVYASVLSAQGERARDLPLTPPEIDATVPAAIEALLPPSSGASPSAAGPFSAQDRVVLKDGTTLEGRVITQAQGSFVVIETPDQRQRTIPWDRIQEVIAGGTAHAGQSPNAGGQEGWNRRGGSLVTFDVQALVFGMMERYRTKVDKTFTSNQTMQFTGDSNAGGGGGGIGLHLGYLYMGAPDVAKAGSTWSGFHLGTGLEFAYSAFGHRTDADIKSGLRDQSGTILKQGTATGGETTWGSAVVVMIPFLLGGQFGFGKFWDNNRWGGTMLGIDWRPTYYYAKPGDSGSKSGINPLGFQLSLDIGSLEVASRTEANFRMSAFVLPGISDNPTMASLGFGAVWY